MCVELEMPIKGSPWVWCDIPLRALHRAPQVSQSPKLSFLLPHFTPNLLVLPPFYPLLFSLVLSALLLSMVQTSYAHTFWCSLLSNCRWETSFNILAVSQSIRVHHQHQFGGVCVGFAYRLVAVVKCDPCFLVVEAPFSKRLPSHFCSHFALQHLSIFVSIMQFMLALITLWSWFKSAITFEDFFFRVLFCCSKPRGNSKWVSRRLFDHAARIPLCLWRFDLCVSILSRNLFHQCVICHTQPLWPLSSSRCLLVDAIALLYR